MDLNKLKDFCKNNINLIIGVVLLILVIFMWQRSVNVQNELNALKAQVDVSKSVIETQSQLDAMKKRQQELYPELQKVWDQLKATNAELELQKKKLVTVKREVVSAQVEKMDIDTLSNLYTSLGYSNSVIGSRK